MTRDELQKAAIRAGYSVSERSSHLLRTWDYSRPGKGPMQANHYRSEEGAWMGALASFQAEIGRARIVLAALNPPASPPA